MNEIDSAVPTTYPALPEDLGGHICFWEVTGYRINETTLEKEEEGFQNLRSCNYILDSLEQQYKRRP